MNILYLFIILSIVNVVFSTIRSIVTIKCGKYIASVINAGYFAFYNVVLIYTVADFPLWEKCVITFACNLIGVFAVKFAEEKARKDRLWKIELTIPSKYAEIIDCEFEEIPHSFIKLSDKHTLFNFYCATQKESQRVKDLANLYGAKYFVAESKIL